MGTKTKTPEQEIAVIAKEVVTFQEKANSFVIKGDDDVAAATDFLAELKARYDSAEAMRTFFVKPLNDQVKSINAMFKEQTTPLSAALSTVKRAVGDYTLAQEEKARKEEARKQKIRDAANAKREAEGKGQILDPVKSVERSEATTKTSAGRSTTRKVWKFEVEKAADVPREFLVVDESAIRKAVAAGARDIKGVRIYEDVQVSVSAN